MKKLTFIVAHSLKLSVLVAMLFSTNVVKADVYSDGLTKLFNDNMISPMFQAGNLKDASEDMKKVMETSVEWMASHFRQNMSEAEFNQMMDFYNQPNIKEANMKIISKVNNMNDQDATMQLYPGIMKIMQGQEAEDVKVPECSADYKAAFEKYWEISDGDEAMKSLASTVSQMISTQMPNQGEEAEKSKKIISAFMVYMEKNMKNISMTVCVKSISKEDLDTYNSIHDQSFYPSYHKAYKSMMGDMGTLIQSIAGKMVKE